MAVVYLSLGSNLGDRTQNLVQACTVLHQHPAIDVQAVSSLYHTAPVGFTDQDWFLNAVVRIHTTLRPASLLSVTQGTERRLDRTITFRWGPRIVDVDILLYDALRLQEPYLTIPHAAMYERLFVLIPLAEVAPDLQFPDGKCISEYIAMFPDRNSVQRLQPFPPFADGRAS